MRALLTLLAVLAVALAARLDAWAQQPGRPISTLIGDAVVQETASETAAVVGRFVSTRGGPIAARVPGAVDAILVDVGDRVVEGQTLARLATDRLEAENDRRRALLALASARIRTAKASLKLATQSADRLVKLRRSAAFSEALLADKQQEAERAAAQVKEAEADYARARAELRLAELELAYAEVRAPYPGVVAERHTDVGGFVALGAPVVTLVGDTALEVEAEAPTDRMGGVRPGAMATVVFAEAEGPIKVRAVMPQETGVSRTRTVRFGPLPPAIAQVAIANAAVTVAIPVAAAQSVVTIHKDAIVRQASGPAAVIASPSATDPGVYQADIRAVRLGSAIGGRFIVLEGAAPGDIAVIRGNETLRPGQPFKLAARATAGKPTQ